MPSSGRRAFLKTTGSVAVIGALSGYTQQNDPIDGTANSSRRQNSTESPQQREDAPSGDDPGLFRVLHASPDAPDIDVYFDREKAVTDMNFGDVSPYVEVSPDRYRVRVTEENDPSIRLASTETTVAPREVTTAVMYGELTIGADTELKIKQLSDNLSTPEEGMSRVRFFHASPDAPAIDILGIQSATEANRSATAPLVENLRFGEASTSEIPAGTRTLEIRPAGQQQSRTDDQPVSRTVRLSAQSGSVYSVFAVGYLNPTAVAADEEFEFVLVADALSGQHARGATE